MSVVTYRTSGEKKEHSNYYCQNLGIHTNTHTSETELTAGVLKKKNPQNTQKVKKNAF